ncbi:hypothetical protein BJX68DRAFT_241761 [Aspergillus pseudodeflectus]|uniref:Zn(2)-C6 fungal-type domain-containing protein n=1 Tax=Aspergillus pseudodeflectus TaxID=176178 RepID=A0ABR4K184_9EURO
MDPSVMVNVQHGTETPLPRRALRKGTKSCAECKRRKTRCFFERPTDVACAACQRRGMPCFGQEYMDVPVPSFGGEHTIVERLKRAELILGTISKDITPDGRASQSAGSGSQSGLSQTSSQDRNADHSWDQSQQGSEGSQLGPWSDTGETAVEEPDPGLYDYPPSRYAELCSALHVHLPCQEDVNILFGTGRAIVFVQAICNHYGELFHQGNFRPLSSMATLPAVTAHPVVIARKLLQLALCLQQLDPSFDQSALHLDGSIKDTMLMYFNLATSKVTCREELLDSIEGLECLVYEGVFLVNSGNIRRALGCLRRASTLAQFMGLHRTVPYKNMKQYDSGTHVSSAVVWAHITFLERYMSLLLGMPTAIARIRIGSDEPLAGDTSLDWFEKVQTDMFERMIERNQEGNYQDLAATQQIDLELNKMANSVPSKWWAPLDLTQGMDNKTLMEKIIGAHLQIVHYNLLSVLHLPYLLWDTEDTRFEYSKATCIYASREVLNRFITFRSIVKLVTCCRPVDFCAFTAALTLLLTYLNNHKKKSGMLAHQRMGDRALIESTVEMMEELNKLNNDELSRRSAELVRKLLDLEADCARGGQTYNSSVEENQDETVANEEHCFHLKIPYFGTVKLACDAPVMQYPDLAPAPVAPSFNQYSTWSNGGLSVVEQPMQVPHLAVPNEQIPFGAFGGAGFDLEMPDLLASAEDWAFQGVDSAFFDAVMSGIPPSTAHVTESQNWGGYTSSI